MAFPRSWFFDEGKDRNPCLSEVLGYSSSARRRWVPDYRQEDEYIVSASHKRKQRGRKGGSRLDRRSPTTIEATLQQFAFSLDPFLNGAPTTAKMRILIGLFYPRKCAFVTMYGLDEDDRVRRAEGHAGGASDEDNSSPNLYDGFRLILASGYRRQRRSSQTVCSGTPYMLGASTPPLRT